MMRKFIKKLLPFPYIPQVGLECGTTALAILLKSYGLPNLQMSLVKYVNMGDDGISLDKIAEIAQLFDFEADGYQIAYDNFELIHLPCIVHYGSNHFVVVYKVSPKFVWISDPAYGKRKLTKEKFLTHWKGVVLNVLPPESPQASTFAKQLIVEDRKSTHEILAQYFLPVLKKHQKQLALAFLLVLVFQFGVAIIPTLCQYMVDQLVKGVEFIQLLIPIALIFAAIPLGVGIALIAKQLLSKFSHVAENEVFNHFFEHLLHIQQAYFDAHSKEDLVFRFLEKSAVRYYFSEIVLSKLVNAFMTVIYLILLAFFSPIIALFALLYSMMYLSLSMMLERKTATLEAQVTVDKVKSTGMVYDSLVGMETIKSAGLSTLLFEKWQYTHRQNLASITTNVQQQLRFESYVQLIDYTAFLGLIFSCSYLWINGNFSLGACLATVLTLFMLRYAVQAFKFIYDISREFGHAFYQLKDVFAQQSELTMGKITKLPFLGAIDVENLTFYYTDNQEKASLSTISIAIKPGEKLGIVGRNGSGKSTLAKVLLGFYDHFDGKISYGGLDFREINRQAFREKVFYFPQEAYLFGDTIRNNITCGMEVSDEELFEAIDKAQLTGFVDDLYYGIDQRVGEWGMHISKGQQLKIAFARLFLRNPDIIILDEASSALDMEAESKIMEALYTQFADKTIIAIAHRMHTLKSVDRLIVLDQGALVEMGTHDELWTQKSLYRKLIEFGL